MAAELLLLALYAALHPTVLAVVVIVLALAGPRRVVTVHMIGGMSVSIGPGLVIVFVLSGAGLLNRGESSGTSWKAGLTIGGLALPAAVTVALRANERMHERRRRRGHKPTIERDRAAVVAADPCRGSAARQHFNDRRGLTFTATASTSSVCRIRVSETPAFA